MRNGWLIKSSYMVQNELLACQLTETKSQKKKRRSLGLGLGLGLGLSQNDLLSNFHCSCNLRGGKGERRVMEK